MRDRKYRDVTREPDEDDVVREIVDRQASHIAACNTRNESSCFGKLLEVQEHLTDFCRESASYLAAPFSVPSRCLTQIAACAFA